MDPVSAVGVAAAVFQFLDVGKRVLSRAHQMNKSQTNQTEQERRLLEDLYELRQAAARAEKSNSAAQKALEPEPSPDDEHGDSEEEETLDPVLRKIISSQIDALEKVKQDIGSVASEFEGVLTSLEKRRNGVARGGQFQRAWQSVTNAVLSLRDGEAVKEMSGRLERIQNQVLRLTLSALWDTTKYIAQREVRFEKMLEEMMGELRLIEKSGSKSNPMSRPSGASKIDCEIITTLNELDHDETRKIYEELVDVLWHPKQKPTERLEGWKPTGVVHSRFCHAILDSIISGVFEEIDNREIAVPKSHKDTCTWIFEEPIKRRDGRDLWSNFPAWLESQDKTPYWITGKPGSGKSTIVKYILHNPLLKKHLETWADGRPIQVTSFYAWNAGSGLQKSLQGLMRTFFHQCLESYLKIIPRVCPRRWALLCTLRHCETQPSWKDWEVKESFDLLLEEITKKKRLAIFIDGLDEFEVVPKRMLDFVQELSTRPGIKVCVASRPWSEFNDALDSSPMICMQDVTVNDMLLFVNGNVGSNRAFMDMKKTFPAEAELLVQEVVEKANGVFIWVSVVAKLLQNALNEGEGLTRLRSIVESLPEDIGKIYDRIWDSIVDHKSASALMELKRTAEGALPFVTLWKAEGGYDEMAQGKRLGPLTEDVRVGLRRIMVRRLDRKTRGILELTPTDHVEFIHRTASDWAAGPKVRSGMTSHLPSEFDPNLRLMQAEADQLRAGQDGPSSDADTGKVVDMVLEYARKVSPGHRATLVGALDEFDRHVGPRDVYRPGMASPACSFIDITCRFCIVPYVEAKLAADRTRLDDEALSSALHNALFGHRMRAARTMQTHASKIPLECRRAMAALLLGRGARLADRVVANIGALVHQYDSDPEERAYWAEIQNMLVERENRNPLQKFVDKTKHLSLGLFSLHGRAERHYLHRR